MRRLRSTYLWLGFLVCGTFILTLQATLTMMPCPSPDVPGPATGANNMFPLRVSSQSHYVPMLSGEENCRHQISKTTATQDHAERPFALSVGLPKSGTTSLYHFFHCSGYPTTHYCCCGSSKTEYPCSGGTQLSEQLKANMKQGVHFWNGTGSQTVHTQLDGETKSGSYFLPQHYHLDTIHQTAPDALWILPLRPAKDWKRSVDGWLDMAKRLAIMHKEYEAVSVESSEFSLEEFYAQHSEKIRQFCQDHREPGSCLEIDIMSPNVGELLAQHVPGTLASCWGKHNSGPFFQVRQPP